MIKIIERDNWITVKADEETVFEGEELNGSDLEDVLNALGIPVDYTFTPGWVPVVFLLDMVFFILAVVTACSFYGVRAGAVVALCLLALYRPRRD